jgi:hypothetical protein
LARLVRAAEDGDLCFQRYRPCPLVLISGQVDARGCRGGPSLRGIQVAGQQFGVHQSRHHLESRGFPLLETDHARRYPGPEELAACRQTH